jgi:REP element-mobilizing transposase RayT
MVYEENHPQFFTATIYEWQPLLKDDKVKDIIVNSLRFLVKDNRISLYSFVIMSNHIHLIWRIKSPHLLKNVQRDFLKYTAQQIKFYLQKTDALLLDTCKVNHHDREYMIWKTDSLSVDLYSKKIFDQKMDYIHNNPVEAGICSLPEEYEYSSASHYIINKSEWDFIASYDE